MTLREIAQLGAFCKGFSIGLKFSCKDCGKCKKLEAENEKLREALKELLVVAQNRLPTMPTVDELEIVRKAQDFINGISKKADDISRKEEAK